MQESELSSNSNDSDNYQTGERRRSVFIAIIVIVILLLLGGISFYLVTQTTYIFPRAAELSPATTTSNQAATISLPNSYLFASPLTAKTGVERIRITAFILNSDGLGVPGQTVVMGNNNSSLHVYPISPTTDDTGRAIFDVASDRPGLYTMEASVGNKIIPQKVNITFD